jgi:type I restriction enzyme S subunit
MSKQWPTVSLGELLRLERRKVKVEPEKLYQEIGIYCFGRGIFHKNPRTGFEVGDKDLFLMKEGDFILQVTFAWEGAIAIVSAAEDGMYGSTRYPTFRVDESRCVPRFLLSYFKTEQGRQQLVKICPGSAGRNRVLSIKRIPEVLVPLPPLAEQRRVVARIEELAAQIHEARTLRHQAAEEAEALTASASAKWFEPKPGWQVKQVGDFCESPQYGYTESASRELVGPRFLRITDIQDGRVNWNSVPYCRCPEPDKYLLKPNDLVFARTGATTGKSFVIRDCPEAVFASYLIRLRVRDTISVDYLYRYFQSPSYWAQIADEKEGTGQPNLNGSKLAKIKVPIAPLAEQRRIVAELDALQAEVDALKRLQAETAAELDALLPAILDRAFKGEL